MEDNAKISYRVAKLVVNFTRYIGRRACLNLDSKLRFSSRARKMESCPEADKYKDLAFRRFRGQQSLSILVAARR